jgi:hypothetical protein
MSTVITTVVSADYFQLYIPLFVMALRTWYNGNIRIYVRGDVDPRVEECVRLIGFSVDLVPNYNANIPNLASTANSLRFIVYDMELSQNDAVIITDADMLVFSDPFPWHTDRITMQNPFACHHGAWNLPRRPSVCNSWRGSFERVAGGMFCATPGWYYKTREARLLYHKLINGGLWGNYREADEVMLARIIKGSGMRVPQSKDFPADLRGLHLGDFKPAMGHRWNNSKKMKALVTEKTIEAYFKLSVSPKWKQVVKALHCSEINIILNNVSEYLKGRSFGNP